MNVPLLLVMPFCWQAMQQEPCHPKNRMAPDAYRIVDSSMSAAAYELGGPVRDIIALQQ
jgi:hypothetical protein